MVPTILIHNKIKHTKENALYLEQVSIWYKMVIELNIYILVDVKRKFLEAYYS
jgi:hypothetical protein